MDKLIGWIKIGSTDCFRQVEETKLKFFWTIIEPLIQALFLGYGVKIFFDKNFYEAFFYASEGLIAWSCIRYFIIESANIKFHMRGISTNYLIPEYSYLVRILFNSITLFCLRFIPMMFLSLVIVGESKTFFFLTFLLLIIIFCPFVKILINLGRKIKDLYQFLSIIMNCFFFVSPIIWPSDSIIKIYLIKYNPFYYYFEILRGNLNFNINYIFMLALTIILTFLLSLKLHDRT